MILTLDVGNTQIFGGVYEGDNLKLTFRKTSKGTLTSDELGLFLRQVLRENGLDPKKIREVGVSSVVPDINRTIHNSCMKYLGLEPFMIGPGIKTGLNIRGRDAANLGADRVADAIAAMNIYPDRNLLIIDFGTANTYDAISKNKEYKGGAIQIGVSTSLNALIQNAALLSKVEILDPGGAASLTTEGQIQAGLYYGNLGAIKEFITRIKKECFGNEESIVIGTGGMGRLFESAKVFDVYLPDLVILGIKIALEQNRSV
ncbi:Putative transcriptional activator [Elusimicrobium minutum Pei191]|uniref:Type III pantothenate kinase n=1 Tax=Elusimicrobium minutum (strain Pei191) TaxID=445932 RepID=COAX_ELUMP|nr:type III pantothenate kinase [Elusimicrobium minutum]B2KBD0.1 RecName: Full=Type III pantothenate kinase; AltName: Full=PanK-III; AltName: Full=Pantothenic acid kinase [Elusimicrobium minutum Pei191]ACC97952.1 Putative transcriptional activator [Elusimicrobium minutum Pei191]